MPAAAGPVDHTEQHLEMVPALAPVDLAAPTEPDPSVWCVCYGPGMALRAYLPDQTRALLQAQQLHGRIVRLAALDPWPHGAG